MIGIMDYQCPRAILILMIFIANANAQYEELKMVHVIFRHGERTPTSTESGERYPNDPYLNETFFPEGAGGLTNDGKLSMYNLGINLRERYNDFLGDIYYPEVTKIRSTESARAMMSAQLVNAGLWQPAETQQWNKNLLWMPIPYEYISADTDSLLVSYRCPTYQVEYDRVMESSEVQELIKPHLDFFNVLSEYTGSNITTPQQVFFLYHTLESQVNCNLTLPSWTEDYYPDGQMYNVTLLQYDISAWGDLLKKIYGGPIIREVLEDYKVYFEDSSSSESSPKITLYSGHESNICSLLKTLGLWTPHVPDFSAAVIFELYLNNSTNDYGIQILYFLGKSEETIPLTLPGCTQICPVNEFTELLSNVIPEDVDELCGFTSRSSSMPLQTTLYITLQLWILLKMT